MKNNSNIGNKLIMNTFIRYTKYSNMNNDFE